MTPNAKKKASGRTKTKVKTRTTVATPTVAAAVPHKNHMAGTSFDLTDPVMALRISASSCFFGEPTFYQGTKGRSGSTRTAPPSYLRTLLHSTEPLAWDKGGTPAEMMTRTIDAALDHDPERTLIEAALLRNDYNIRTTPQVILVRAANHPKVRGTGLVRKYASEIIKRVDEPAVQLAYQLAIYGKDTPIPNQLKKAWRTFLGQQTAYALAKYKSESKEVKLLDVVNLSHPKSTPALKALMEGKLVQDGETWESLISTEGSTKATWGKAVDVMGHMALLRNLRNLVDKGVDPKVFLPKLVGGVATGKQLPFRYYSAYQALKTGGTVAPGSVIDAVEECVEKSVANVPRLRGRTMSLCDNSGSARGATTSSMGSMAVATIANLTGVLAALASDEGHVGVFGNKLETFDVAKKGVFDNVDRAEKLGHTIGQDTENGIWLFWKKAIENREHWDNVFVFSDMQAGHGGLYGLDPRTYHAYRWQHGNNIDVAKLITVYRQTVNPKVNVYLVQVAGYTDTLVPEFYDRTFILGGWGEGVLKFAASMAGIYEGRG